MAALDEDTIRGLPKVLLHDHLDGGLRPHTVAELAEQTGYADLPTHDPAELATWFKEAGNSGSLERYLEPFQHTVGVTQTADALARVASECAQDLADDGVKRGVHRALRVILDRIFFDVRVQNPVRRRLGCERA